jgi:hypothetical protein
VVTVGVGGTPSFLKYMVSGQRQKPKQNEARCVKIMCGIRDNNRKPKVPVQNESKTKVEGYQETKHSNVAWEVVGERTKVNTAIYVLYMTESVDIV